MTDAGRPQDNDGNEPGGPLGWALYLWTDYQDQNPQQPAHKLWPRFLAVTVSESRSVRGRRRANDATGSPEMDAGQRPCVS
jgi:hypothetical protein